VILSVFVHFLFAFQSTDSFMLTNVNNSTHKSGGISQSPHFSLRALVLPWFSAVKISFAATHIRLPFYQNKIQKPNQRFLVRTTPNKSSALLLWHISKGMRKKHHISQRLEGGLFLSGNWLWKVNVC